LIGEAEITLDGRMIKYQVKQSRRLRGYRLEIRHGSGLTVVVPGKYGQGEIDDLIRKKSHWILKHLPADDPLQLPLFKKDADHGEKIPYMGRQIEIVLTEGKSRKPSAVLDGNRLLISANGQSMSRVLEAWYREQAAAVFKDKADAYKNPMGVSYRQIFIRGQRTRWASCSQQRNLTFNWKLLLAPEHIIDYVIVHELSHIRHMNHSRQFWEMVAQYCPKWKQYRKWLLAHEEQLKSSATFAM
jgi:predicted metal-dependent hydrolase